MKLSIEISEKPIAPPPISFPTDGSFGALSEFYGIVRGTEKGDLIAHLSYECYQSMAEKEIRTISEALFLQYPCLSVEIIHRIGTVPVGEPSLWVRTIGKHRQESLRFIDEFIVLLKEKVPIWKRF